MPIIRIDFDGDKVSEQEVITLSSAARDIVSEVTQIKDVFVYANSSQIKIKIAPIEMFVEMSASKVSNTQELSDKIKDALSSWKKENAFPHPVNFTFIPRDWVVEIDI